MKKLSKKKVIIISIIILVIAFIAINALKPKEDPYSEEVAKSQDISIFYSFEGNVSAKDSQEVVSKTSLSVKKFHVKEGDNVKVGDILFELDDSNISSSLDQATASVELAKINYDVAVGTSKEQQTIQTTNALESAKSSYDSAKLNLDRIKGLYDIEAAALVELEQAQSTFDNAAMQLKLAQSNFDNLASNINNNIRTAQEQLNQAKASLASMQKQAEDIRVLAEVDGEVSDIHVVENESIVMGKPIMDIVNFNNLEIVLKVDEYDLASISLGKDAEVTINSIGENVKGKVTDISKQATVVNGVSYFETIVSLEKNENLRVGLTAEVEIIKESAVNATVISMKALQFDENNLPYVYYRDASGQVVTKSVKVGINDGIIVEITEGIEPGESILVPITIINPMAGPGQGPAGGVE